MSLRDNDVRPDRRHNVFVYLIEGLLRTEMRSNRVVDLPARTGCVEIDLGAYGKSANGRRIIALMGPTDEVALEAESADDFGRARDKGNDSRNGRPQAAEVDR